MTASPRKTTSYGQPVDMTAQARGELKIALWGAEARISSYTINESRSICRAINRANRKVADRSEA